MFLTVLIILGIVVAGGFLIYFVADLIMSLANKNKDKDAISQKQERERKELVDRIEALENKDELKQDPEVKELLYKGAEVEAFDPFAEEKKEEPEAEEETVEENAEEPEVEENAEQEDLDAEIARRKQALMERLAILQKQDDEEGETEQEETETQPAEETEVEETNRETADETVEEPTEETVEENAETIEEETSGVEDQGSSSVVENAEYEEAQADTNLLASTYTKDELLAKLAEEQERLKANEKDLRASKKEFIPLRRVKKTLEKDEVKLRRKEALVAKQEVLLHGVNNYSDIDEEKAKKLAEDLDLLDGLKLSVQHCQEVMDKNKERYPLLEKIYNLLVSQNAEIKENIKNLQEAIDSLKDEEE